MVNFVTSIKQMSQRTGTDSKCTQKSVVLGDDVSSTLGDLFEPFGTGTSSECFVVGIDSFSPYCLMLGFREMCSRMVRERNVPPSELRELSKTISSVFPSHSLRCQENRVSAIVQLYPQNSLATLGVDFRRGRRHGGNSTAFGSPLVPPIATSAPFSSPGKCGPENILSPP